METENQAQRLKNLHLRAAAKRRQTAVQHVKLKPAEDQSEQRFPAIPVEEEQPKATAVPEEPMPRPEETSWKEQDLPEAEASWEQLPEGYGNAEQAGSVPAAAAVVFDDAGILEENRTEPVEEPAEEAPLCPKKRLFSWGRLVLTILFVCSLVAWSAARHHAAFADFYARNIYPKAAAALSVLTDWLPFSLGEVLSVLAVLSLTVCLLIWIVRLIGKKGRGLRFLRGFLALFFTAAAVFSCFVWTAGINYARPTWAELSGLQVKKSGQEELARLYENMIEAANKEAALVERKGDAMPKAGTVAQVGRQAGALMDRMAREDQVLIRGSYSNAKPVFLSVPMSYARIAGIFFPFTGEANINQAMPEIEYPVTVCHELAHQRGVMREEEANFLAVKACLQSEDPAFRYSALLMAITYAGNALYEENPKLWEELTGKMSSPLRSDRRQIALLWSQYDTSFGAVSESINDAYLQANGQSQGVKSYGAFLDLMLSDPELGAFCA